MPTCQKQHVCIEIKSEKLANDVSEATKGSHPRNFRAALRLVRVLLSIKFGLKLMPMSKATRSEDFQDVT